MCTVSVSSPDTSYYENWPGPNSISRLFFNRNGTLGSVGGGGGVVLLLPVATENLPTRQYSSVTSSDVMSRLQMWCHVFRCEIQEALSTIECSLREVRCEIQILCCHWPNSKRTFVSVCLDFLTTFCENPRGWGTNVFKGKTSESVFSPLSL